jgi:hypothetical protein
MKRATFISLLLFALTGSSPAQESIRNSLLRMTPVYQNPACLFFDEVSSHTLLGPTIRTIDGDMRRLYDPGNLEEYEFSSQVVRILGSKGTFRANASYVYENRNEVWSSLRMNAYEGDGFLPADTTLGNFRISGPEVRFEYGYEILPRFAVGFIVNYRLMDGLKDAFTNAHAILRSVDYGAGVKLQTEGGDCLALMILGLDDQERIESKSNDDLRDVEVFSYRGDTYATRRRSMTLEEMLRTKGIETALEFRYHLASDWTIIGNGKFFFSGFRSLFPSGYLVEYEDGYSQFRSIAGEVVLTHNVGTDLVLRGGCTGGSALSWSRISSRQLLFWEWDAADYGGYIDGKYRLSEKTHLSLLATIGNITTDSSKYIDNRFTTTDGIRYGVRAGISTKVMDVAQVELMAGIQHLDFDVMRGGKNVNALEWNALVSYPLTPKLLLMGGYYGDTRRGDLPSKRASRGAHSIGLSIKILQD